MSSKTDVWETRLLQLLFQNTNVSFAGTTLTGSATAGFFYISLHTADPVAGNQTTSEVSYTGYARVAVARSSSGWSVAAGVASPVSDIVFPSVSAGSGTVTHFGIGTASSGTGNLLFVGTVSPNITITVNKKPMLAASSTIVEA